jgi:hypothetical protein
MTNMKRQIDLQSQAHSLGISQTATSAPHIFPTSRRDRQSRLLSYPIGTEILSHALNGVPQRDHLQCWFSASDHLRLQRATQLAVLSISYRRRRITQSDPRNALELGRLAPNWTICVYGVLRQHRHQIREALIGHILPGPARQWLMKEAPEHGIFADCGITLSVDLTTGDVFRGWPRR